MTRFDKILSKILRGASDANIGFEDLRLLLTHLDFEERVRGSHHIFTRDDVEEIVNLQPKGKNAKAYQVKQVRNLIVKYRLASAREDDLEDDTL